MFKEIATLKTFGAFKSYTWPVSQDMRSFSKFNLIYGWNYAGKTTISRVFDCLRQGELTAPFKGATFRILLNDGTTVTNQNLRPNFAIRVFNVDYVDRNLCWHRPNDGLEPVFLLGEENVTLQSQLEIVATSLSNLESKAKDIAEEVSKLDKNLNQKLTDEAKRIKQDLWADRTEAFERPRLVRTIVELGQLHSNNILSDANHTEENAKLWSRPLGTLPKVTLPLEFTSLLAISKDWFAKTPTGSVIGQLQQNPEVNLWAKKGWELHQHLPGEQCAFCGNELSQNRIEELDDHFSKAYQEQLDQLLKIKSAYTAARDALERTKSFQFNAGNFYGHLTAKALSGLQALPAEITREQERLDLIVRLLGDKEKNLFNQVIYNDSSVSEDLERTLIELNTLIQEHNAYTQGLNETRESARAALTHHAASQAATATEYFEIVDKRESLDKGKAAVETEIKKLAGERQGLLAKLDQSAKGAEKINEYLACYFGKAELRIEPNERKRFDVKRFGQTAGHLSEGEKTAISFAHFIATLEERGAKIEEAIVFIDDPVSSLDSNHLFGVFSLIESRLQNCKQLFVSTHNHDFFDLLLQWRMNNGGNVKDDSAAYLVRRKSDSAEFQSDLVDLPSELIKFRSEYVYLFSLIYRCVQNPVQGGELLTLPNAMRRFLEAFMRFKYLGLTEKARWEQCFQDSSERVRKYVHIGSHENAMRATKIPERQEAIEISKLVMEMLKRADNDHFEGLVSKVKG